MFKNQKIGTLSSFDEVLNNSSVWHSTTEQQPNNTSVQTGSVDNLRELGVDLDQSKLSQNERQQLQELIVSYADVFSKGKRELGTCKLGTKHHIHLKPDTMHVKQRACRIPFAYQKEVKTDIKSMLEDGIIEKSCSEWASPLVIVRKSSGDLRICVDYRKLNDVTMVTSYPLPNITETLDKLAGATNFTSIDMVSGYHQVEVAEEDKEKTAFVSPYGLY